MQERSVTKVYAEKWWHAWEILRYPRGCVLVIFTIVIVKLEVVIYTSQVMYAIKQPVLRKRVGREEERERYFEDQYIVSEC